MRRFLLFVFVVAVCVFALYRWTEGRGPKLVPEQFTPAEGPKVSDDDVHVLEAMDSEYTKLVQAVVPSVVSITATKRVESPEVEDPFELFFGRRFRVPRREEEMRSLGPALSFPRRGILSPISTWWRTWTRSASGWRMARRHRPASSGWTRLRISRCSRSTG